MLDGQNIHIVEESNLPLLVSDNREVERVAANLLDIGGPAIVAVNRVGAQAEQLDTALGELGLQTGHLAQLGGANGGVVLRVGEENDPVVADILVQVNGTLGGVGLEVRGDGAQAEAVVHGLLD